MLLKESRFVKIENLNLRDVTFGCRLLEWIRCELATWCK